MEFEITSMAKEQSKAKVSLFGPSGSGKTTAALKIAKGIQEQLYPKEDFKKVAVIIDTENRSSTKAIGRSIDGEKIEACDMIDFKPPFDIFKLCECVNYCISQGKKIIIIDSYSAFWSGDEGIVERAAEIDAAIPAGQKKAYGAWSEKEIISRKNALKNLMITMDAHIICCNRAKTEYVIEQNSRGKMAPRAVGVKEDNQGDVRYEFDLVLSIDKETHVAEIVKDRIGYPEVRATSDRHEKPLSIADGKEIAKIINEGISLEELAERKMNTLIAFVNDERNHKSTKLVMYEKKLGYSLTEEKLRELGYEKVYKLVEALKN